MIELPANRVPKLPTNYRDIPEESCITCENCGNWYCKKFDWIVDSRHICDDHAPRVH